MDDETDLIEWLIQEGAFSDLDNADNQNFITADKIYDWLNSLAEEVNNQEE